jgi:cytochrome b561
MPSINEALVEIRAIRGRVARGAGFRGPGPALCVIFTGALGLLYDSWVYPRQAACHEVHALFGMLLNVSIIASFYSGMKYSPRLAPVDIRAFSRRLSRRVFLLLYMLMGLKLLIIAAQRSNIESIEDFQGYLAYGVIALVVIHALAARWRRLATRGTPA